MIASLSLPWLTALPADKSTNSHKSSFDAFETRQQTIKETISNFETGSQRWSWIRKKGKSLNSWATEMNRCIFGAAVEVVNASPLPRKSHDWPKHYGGEGKSWDFWCTIRRVKRRIERTGRMKNWITCTKHKATKTGSAQIEFPQSNPRILINLKMRKSGWISWNWIASNRLQDRRNYNEWRHGLMSSWKAAHQGRNGLCIQNFARSWDFLKENAQHFNPNQKSANIWSLMQGRFNYELARETIQISSKPHQW